MTRVAALYFVLVFGVGFVLGPIRVLLFEPQLGARSAELIEAPIMFLAICLISRWLNQRQGSPFIAIEWVKVGFLAAAGVLLADIVVCMGLRRMSLIDVFIDRDPVSGAVYYCLVAWMALAPWCWGCYRVMARSQDASNASD